MPYSEFKGWLEYFDKRPVGWQEDNRFYMILRVLGVKQKASELFPSLAAVQASSKSKKNSFEEILPFLNQATGGVKLCSLEAYQ
jgi:hypothetical protein